MVMKIGDRPRPTRYTLRWFGAPFQMPTLQSLDLRHSP